MRKILLLALILLSFSVTFAAYGKGASSNLDKIDGNWACDAKATIAATTAATKAIDPTLKGIPTSLPGESILSDFAMSFDAKGKKVTSIMGPLNESYDFTVVSDSGKSLVLSVADQPMRITFTTNDSFIMYNESDPTLKIVFTRQKQAPPPTAVPQ